MTEPAIQAFGAIDLHLLLCYYDEEEFAFHYFEGGFLA
jgi:hypothetical protein